MNAPERFQQLRVKALRAHTQPVDARCTQTLERGQTECAWIGFQRNLGVFVQCEGFAAGIKNARDLPGRKQAGRAAAKEDRAGASRRSIMPRQFSPQQNFVYQSADIWLA